MKLNVVFLLFGLVSSATAVSFEIPITNAPGDQLYPDVCWDGEAFWVVWQDEELGTIRGIRVNEGGEFLTGEVELMPKSNDGTPVRYPCVAAGGGRIGAECRVKIGYTEFGKEAWGVGHNEFDFDGNPLHKPTLFPNNDNECTTSSTPCLLYGKNHFYSIHNRSFETPGDFHGSSGAFGFDSTMEYTQIWQSSEPELEFFPPVACWDGERLVIIYHSLWKRAFLGAFLDDMLEPQGFGEDFTIGRLVLTITTSGDPKFQSLTLSKSRYLLVSEARDNHNDIAGLIWFDVLDSTCMPIKDSATLLDFNPSIKCRYPDAISDGNDFIAVWENRFEDKTVHLYGIEVDTFGNTLKSGYVVWKGPSNQQPALAYGGGKYLLTWSDNRDGDFDIRGMIFDTLEVFEGVKEMPEPLEECVLKASRNPFRDKVDIYLSQKGGGDDNMTVLIFDMLGRKVNTLKLSPGEERISWEGRDTEGRLLPTGIYFATLNSGNGPVSQTARIVKVR